MAANSSWEQGLGAFSSVLRQVCPSLSRRHGHGQRRLGPSPVYFQHWRPQQPPAPDAVELPAKQVVLREDGDLDDTPELLVVLQASSSAAATREAAEVAAAVQATTAMEAAAALAAAATIIGSDALAQMSDDDDGGAGDDGAAEIINPVASNDE
ncbi:hypothetical protein ZWY2020_044826 [Hordeum vulgare]|nr:hypothetical protein ZWY2020_044826 [Hordeum vulgare]